MLAVPGSTTLEATDLPPFQITDMTIDTVSRQEPSPGLPFLKDLGHAVYLGELSRSRLRKPNLDKLEKLFRTEDGKLPE